MLSSTAFIWKSKSDCYLLHPDRLKEDVRPPSPEVALTRKSKSRRLRKKKITWTVEEDQQLVQLWEK
jgi:hypothetical protein